MQSVINDVFYSVYQYLGFGIIFAVICMVALPTVRKEGALKTIQKIYSSLKTSSQYRIQFFFFAYLFMVLARTLICRNIWKCPWENVIGNWGINTAEGKYNTEGALNILLFFPMIFFYLKCFRTTQYRTVESKKILMKMTRDSFLFLTFIELCHLFLRLGTFQLSDIFQNTLGGLMGAVLFVILNNRK